MLHQSLTLYPINPCLVTDLPCHLHLPIFIWFSLHPGHYIVTHVNVTSTKITKIPFWKSKTLLAFWCEWSPVTQAGPFTAMSGCVQNSVIMGVQDGRNLPPKRCVWWGGGRGGAISKATFFEVDPPPHQPHLKKKKERKNKLKTGTSSDFVSTYP